jgi:hypothetical protein
VLIRSLLLIVGWLVGDAFKTVYFFTTEAPVQFLASGCFQVLTDVYILLQMFVLYAPAATATPTRRPRARSDDTPAVDNQNRDV